ncbi:hypothetical protein FBY12_4030 [Pseudomonas sp. SJZ131]|nr:hypothetical protein FBY12_4030 [Pseudomonas sp. SJZ131]
MSQQPPGKRAGRVLMILAWCAALFLATRFFGQWEERQQNPNAEVVSQQGEGFIEVKLVGNHQGHFVASGQINGQRWISCSTPGPPMWRFRSASRSA